jgi:hypothetical protein
LSRTSLGETIIRASTGIVYSASGNVQPFITTGALGYSGTPTFSSADGYTPVFYWNKESFPQSFKKPPLVDPTFLNGQAQQNCIALSGLSFPCSLTQGFGRFAASPWALLLRAFGAGIGSAGGYLLKGRTEFLG